MLPILIASLLTLEAASTQEENLATARVVRNYSGAAHLAAQDLRLGLQLFGGHGDALSQDPLKQEDFVAPEFSWFLHPRCTLKALYARALRPESDDIALVTAAFTF